MAATVIVTRGYTAVAGTPITVADLNAMALPTVVVDGEFLEPGEVESSDTIPGAYFTGASTGSGGFYLLTLSPAPTGYVNGFWCSFIANHANIGAATININGLGAVDITSPAGEALTGQEIQVGQPVWLQYYATSGHFRMVSMPSKQRTYAAGTGAADTYAVEIADWAVSPTATLSQLVGVPVWWKVSATNTGASTLALNSTAATAIRGPDESVLLAGDLEADAIVCTVFNGTYHLLVAGRPLVLPAVGTAGTVTYPYTIVVDANGRVTTKTDGLYFNAAHDAAYPAKGTAATFTHGLGRTPAFIRVTLVAQDPAQTSFDVGDEVDAEFIHSTSSNTPTFQVTASATTIAVTRNSDADNTRVIGKADGVSAIIEDAKWKVRCRAM